MKDTVNLIEVPSLDNFESCDHRLFRVDNTKICYTCFNVYYTIKDRQLMNQKKASFDQYVILRKQGRL